jgi:alpha-beta hydrolase superfamily lysophospholipase
MHGFTSESGWMVQLTAVNLTANWFAVLVLDHQGHGFFEGLQGHIPDHQPPLPCFLGGQR